MLIVLVRLLAVSTMVLMGVLARRCRLLDTTGTRQISLLVTNILYPALIYASLVQTFTLSSLAANWTLPAGTVMIMLTGFAIGALAAWLVPFTSDREQRAFRFQCTINNYVFLAMPLVQIYWGPDAVALLVFSSAGSEISVWTLGVIALTGHRFEWRTFRHLVSMPMGAILAAVLTLALVQVTGWHSAAGGTLDDLRQALLAALDIVGKGTVPLAMIVAGSRMADLQPRHLWRTPQVAVIALRLAVIPAAALALLHWLPFAAMPRHVLTVVAVMPSAIASVMLSEIYDADGDFAAAAVLLTHVVALLSIPLWLGWVL
jgi:malate permease and related proteins